MWNGGVGGCELLIFLTLLLLAPFFHPLNMLPTIARLKVHDSGVKPFTKI
jgi:hypothetical protein